MTAHPYTPKFIFHNHPNAARYKKYTVEQASLN